MLAIPALYLLGLRYQVLLYRTSLIKLFTNANLINLLKAVSCGFWHEKKLYWEGGRCIHVLPLAPKPRVQFLTLTVLRTHFVTRLCPQRSDGFVSTPFFFRGSLSIPTPKADGPARVCFGADGSAHISIFRHVKKPLRSHVYATPLELNPCRYQRRISVTSERERDVKQREREIWLRRERRGSRPRGLGAEVWCDVTARRIRTHASARSTVRVQDSGVR